LVKKPPSYTADHRLVENIQKRKTQKIKKKNGTPEKKNPKVPSVQPAKKLGVTS